MKHHVDVSEHCYEVIIDLLANNYFKVKDGYVYTLNNN